MKAAAALAIRREVNRQRRAGRTEAQIAQRLTALRISPPTGPAWVAAGVEARWTGTGVTRFMEHTRHVKHAPGPATVTAAPATAAPTSGLRVRGVRGAMIYTSAPDPANIIRLP